ncbi:hypothetical protein ES705_08599 [subsurface metagenome]
MAEERLSKLQKWILNKCFERGEKYAYVVRRRQLIREYCKEFKRGCYAESGDQVDISGIQVSITRSIRTLAFKEYLYVYGTKEKPAIDITHFFSKKQRIAYGNVGANIKFLCLTDGGVVEVKKFLNVNK